MMMSESGSNPTVQVPPWSPFEEPTAAMSYSLSLTGVTGGGDSGECSPYLLGEVVLAVQQSYLPCNDADDDLEVAGEEEEEEEEEEDLNVSVDAYSCNEFRMYEFKVRRCMQGRSHDWTECPYAHPGEKARRRDPRKYHYSGTACPDFRKGSCKRGDACEFAHGVFECWLHPARYRTQPCKDSTACRRRVCFFAHTPEQLRNLPPQQQHQHQQQGSPKATASPAIESYDGSPLRQQAVESYMASKNHQLRGHGHSHLMSSSPTSTLISPPLSPPSDSPPMSPSAVACPTSLSRFPWSAHSSGVNDIVASLRQLQLCKASSAPSSWPLQLGSSCSGGFASPRSAIGSPTSAGFRGGFCSLPTTPTMTSPAMTPGGIGGWFDGLDGVPEHQEVPAGRVESGRALRVKMFERLSKESIAVKLEAAPATPVPDVGWVSELVM